MTTYSIEPTIPFLKWCKIRNMSPSTGYKLVRQGKLKVIKVGARTQITPQEDRRFLEALEEASAAEFAALAAKKRQNKAQIDANKAAARSKQKERRK